MSGMTEPRAWTPRSAPLENGRPEVPAYSYRDPRRRTGPSQVWLAITNLTVLLDRFEPSPEQWAALRSLLSNSRT